MDFVSCVLSLSPSDCRVVRSLDFVDLVVWFCVSVMTVITAGVTVPVCVSGFMLVLDESSVVVCVESLMLLCVRFFN